VSEEILKKLAEAMYEGDSDLVETLTKEALDAGVAPGDIIEKGGVSALDRLGKDFSELVVFLPQLMLAGHAMNKLLQIVRPHLSEKEGASRGKIIIGTAKGDFHDIGKSLVATQLEVSGFEVIDIGTNVSTNEFIQKAEETGADIIAMSSLLTTSQYYMEDCIKRLNDEGKRGTYRVVVGGGPIRQNYAEKIGADGYARTAYGSVSLCKELMKKTPDTEFIAIDA
jgi:5-methyltetrahydrofolate--homocysteine methyltransferase